MPVEPVKVLSKDAFKFKMQNDKNMTNMFLLNGQDEHIIQLKGVAI
jgi:hypothetical protein